MKDCIFPKPIPVAIDEKDRTGVEEVLQLLRDAGLNPMLCDSAVHVSSCSAKCGSPTEIGDDDNSEYIRVPKSLVGLHPEIYIPVDGDSMIEAGYEPGDRLEVRLQDNADDGDAVVILVDGCCTVKSLFTDEDGSRWLVPQNDQYDAILLNNKMNIRILGVVVGVVKSSQRTSTRKMMLSVRKTKQKMLLSEQVNFNSEALEEAIRAEINALEDDIFRKDNEFWETGRERFYNTIITLSKTKATVGRKLMELDYLGFTKLGSFAPAERAAKVNRYIQLYCKSRYPTFDFPVFTRDDFKYIDTYQPKKQAQPKYDLDDMI